MAKKSIEQVFQQKLGADERKPSPQAWKKVAAQLPQKPRKRGAWLFAWLMAGTFAVYGGWHGWKYAEAQPQGVPSNEEQTKTTLSIIQQPLADSLRLAQMPETIAIDLPKPIKTAIARKIAPAKMVSTAKMEASNKTAIEEALPAMAIIPKVKVDTSAANLPMSMGNLQARALPQLASGKRPRQYSYRVEITIPYQQNSSTPTTEPKGKAMMQKILHNVLAD